MHLNWRVGNQKDMLKIYNTLTSLKEIFEPIHPKKIGLYVCGVTVYDYCHIGHARTYTSIDMIVRYLRFSGYQVNYIRNITDVDDKIIKRAQTEKVDYQVVTEKYIQAMQDDFKELGLLPPTHEPRATQYIPNMIALIEKLIQNKHAYKAENGDVYFDVRSFPAYGCLSHHNLAQLESGARVEISEFKRDPLDFALWKKSKEGEPSWPSPWCEGRPGWHIECSAMAMALLGEHFDLHGGGRDLIFPHHENEIAQSQGASNKPFANVWLHGGFLQIEKEKMSKSLGNFITIRDVLKKHESEVVRYFLLASHYRSPLVYSEEGLYQGKQALTRFYTALRFLPSVPREKHSPFEEKFILAMNDDFNTPLALSALFELAHEIQRLRMQDEVKAAKYASLLRYLGGVLGLLQTDAESYFKAKTQIDVAKIETLIAAREKARRDKNWQEADRIRTQLAEMSILIEDGPTGTTWKSLD